MMAYPARGVCFVLLVHVCTLLTHQATAESPADPIVVSPLLPHTLASSMVHTLIMESVSDNRYSRVEEFVDLNAGRQAIRTFKKDRTETLLVEGGRFVNHYEPFWCEKYDIGQLADFEKVQSKFGHLLLKDGSSSAVGMTGLLLKLPSAIQREYKEVEHKWLPSIREHSKAHKWTFWFSKESKEFKTKVVAYFNQVAVSSGVGLPETVEFYEKDQLTHTINIMTKLDYVREESVMHLPVGYGCQMDISSIVYEPIQIDLGDNYRLDLEVVATKFADQRDQSNKVVLINFQYVSTDSRDYGLRLVRRQQSDGDHTYVLDRRNNVLYTIDERLESCKVSRWGDNDSYDDSQDIELPFDHEDASFRIKFGRKHVDDWFIKMEGFNLVKIVPGETDNISYRFYEKCIRNDESKGIDCVIREYEFARVPKSWFDDRSRLVKATILTMVKSDSIVVTDKPDKILQSVHFIFVDKPKLLSGYGIANEFDLASECYLDNPQKRPSRDYAWLRIVYPIPANRFVWFKQMVESNPIGYKTILYKTLQYELGDYRLGPLRMPRLEVSFDDDNEEQAMVVRALILDQLPMEVVMNYAKGQKIVISKGNEDGNENGQRTNRFYKLVSPDLHHCARQCKLHGCQVMSFGGRNCLLSREGLHEGVQLATDEGYETYSYPDDKRAPLRLPYPNYIHGFLGRIGAIRFNDFSPVALPAKPVLLEQGPANNTVSAWRQYHETFDNYHNDVVNFLREKSHNFRFILRAPVGAGELELLLPIKLEFERDPMDELASGLVVSNRDDFDDSEDDDDDDDDDDDQDSFRPRGSIAGTFHEGYPIRKYMMTPELKQQANRLNGLSYDQCALACLDTSCASFSFCQGSSQSGSSSSSECILTTVYNIGQVFDSSTQQDSDCSIYKRDYLQKFHKLANSRRPTAQANGIEVSRRASSPSECAHECATHSQQSNCLAFTYCKPIGSASSDGGDCYLSRERDIVELVQNGAENGGGPTGCDHYTRSYLADFVHLEHLEVVEASLAAFKTVEFAGLTLDQCAEKCALGDDQCSALQFCFDAYSHRGTKEMQKCTLFESDPLEGKQAAKGDLAIELDQAQEVKSHGKAIKFSFICSLNVLRFDSNEAKRRPLAFNLTDPSARSASSESAAGKASSSGGMGILGALSLFLAVTLLVAVAKCGYSVEREHPGYLARGYHWLRLRLLRR